MKLDRAVAVCRVLKRAGIPTMIMGGHGLAKTSVVYQLHCQEVTGETTYLSSIDAKKALAGSPVVSGRPGFWGVSAGNLTIEEMIGMPHVSDLGYKDPVLRYLRMRGLLPDPDHVGGGTWLMDELNTAVIEVQRMFWQVMLERRYLDYVLPDGVWLVSTMNPPSMLYRDARELSAPLMDRGALVVVDPDPEAWQLWASGRGLSPRTRLFASRHNRLVNVAIGDVDMTVFDNPATFRSLELVDMAWAAATEQEITDVGDSLAISLLGREAGVVYHRHAVNEFGKDVIVTANDVVKSYLSDDDAGVDDPGSWGLTSVRKLARGYAGLGGGEVRGDLIHYTLTDLESFVTRAAASDAGIGAREAMRILALLHDMPVDMARGFLMKISEISTRVFSSVSRTETLISVYDSIEAKLVEVVNG